MAPYVDGAITDTERDRVAGHLESCPPCRRAAGYEAAARKVLRARSGALSPSAPLPLRSRLAEAAAAKRRTERGWKMVAYPLAAAACLVAAAGAGLYVTRANAMSLATQLTLDHIKCFTFLEEAGAPTDAVSVSRSLEHYGFHVDVPEGAAEHGLRLLGARRCLTADGRVAHILYSHQGRNVSLFVIPEHEWKAGGASVMGHRTVVWSAGGRGYAVVSSEPEPLLRQAAFYLQQELR